MPNVTRLFFTKRLYTNYVTPNLNIFEKNLQPAFPFFIPRFNYMLTQHKIREHGMEFKGVKLYKTSNRSRKGSAIKPEADSTAAAVASITTQQNAANTQLHSQQPSSGPHPVTNVTPHVLEPSHDSMLSSESSQSHSIQQQHQQHHQPQPLQYQHPVPTAHLERVHYPPGFVYAASAAPNMMLPPGGYSG